MTPLERARRIARAALRPPPKLALSKWIESSVVLPQGVSATPGPVRLWPYQREIADAIGDPSIERVTLVKPVRVGFTSLLTSALGSYVVNDPAPILAVLPTEDDCRNFVVSGLEPTFQASPSLSDALADDTGGADRNTMLSRRFPGGSLKVVAARAPRNLRAHTARVLLLDEVDAMEPGAEGNPLTLAERRTLSFPDRKIVMGSTPTLLDTSNVLRSYAQSDQRVFEVPCPQCGEHTEIMWRHIEWEPGRPETAAFRCPHCEELIHERHKVGMVDRGRWRAMNAAVAGHAGFRLNALVSLLANASWGKLAIEFVGAKDRPEQLQTFVNTILAEGWREAGEEIDERSLLDRVEPISLDAIPDDVLWLTAGVDVQRKDRLEVTVCGWADDGVMSVLDHTIIFGNPLEDEVWSDLDDLLRQRWPHPLGGHIRIDAMVVDSGDGATVDKVYGFCNARQNRRVLAGKGMAGTREALKIGGKVRGGGRVWIIGVDGLKSRLMARLQAGRSVRFSSELGEAWFEQLASERCVVRYTKGQPTRQWVRKVGMDAEALDCMTYAMAARHALTSSAATRREALAERDDAKKPRNRMADWSAQLNR